MGVVLWFYRQFGIELPDPVSEDPEAVLAHSIVDWFTRQHAPGDGYVASFYDDSGESGASNRHVGVIVGHQILHATHRHGIVATPFRLMNPAGYYALKAEHAPRS